MQDRKYHSLLKRQVKRYFGESFEVPKDWERFLEAVSDAYKENDIDRGMLERSLDLSSGELLQANSEMGAVIKAFPDIFFRIAADGTILEYKSDLTFDPLPGEKHYLGKRVQDLSDWEIGTKFSAAISQVNETKAMTVLEYPLTIRGREEFFEARLVPVLKNQIFAIIRNVTMIKEARAELQMFTSELESIVHERTRELSEANLRLKELDAVKTDFISSVSHELRTPLTSVIGFTHIIKDRLAEVIFPALPVGDLKVERSLEKVKADIEIILSEGGRLTNLINDVLDITKMEAGQMEWEMAPVDLHEIIMSAYAATSPIFEQKKLRFIPELAATSHFVVGDRDRLIQVLINLYSNAVKFTEAGSIRVLTSARNDEIVVSVIDTGIGIAPSNHRRIFEKFRQVGDTLTDKPKGTGLGLPICLHIIEHLGGKLRVESEMGKGSNFSFEIPVFEIAV